MSPRVHDFRRQGWGRAIHMPDIKTRVVAPPWWQRALGKNPQTFEYLTCMGHSTPTPWEGDILLIPMQSGKTGKWRIIESRWVGDPRDMFDVRRADFEGYLEDEETSHDRK